MSERNFRELLENRWSRGNFVCVGLDPLVEKLPEPLKSLQLENCDPLGTQFSAFCQDIVDATAHLVCAFKPNAAFFERLGWRGWKTLREIIEVIHIAAPEVPVILDAKRGDVAKSNEGYAAMAFDYLKADAITVHPYLGAEALEPFLRRADKGIFVLCRTSNPGAGEFQDLSVGISKEEWRVLNDARATPVSIGTGGIYTSFSNHVAYRVSRHWNTNKNCGLVVGATYPGELHSIRAIAGDIPLLIPGIGAQGGDLEKTVTAGKDVRGRGFLVNSSSGIIFASKGVDFAEAARCEAEKLHDEINQYRGKETT